VTGVEVSVIVINWNTKDYLAGCLDSLRDGGLDGLTAEVWVIDNASQDGSAQMVRARYPWVRLIANETNLGFSAANNAAMRGAAGRFFFLLNADMLVPAGLVRGMVARVRAAPDVGVAACRQIDGEGRDVESYKFNYRSGRIPEVAPLAPRPTRQGDPVEVSWVWGSGMLVRREVVDQTGGFDESFFMYYEDLDWCRRIRSKGWKVVYYPDLTVTHFVRASTMLAPPALTAARLVAGELSLLAKYTPRTRFCATMAWRFVYALRGILFYGLMSALAPSKRYITKYWRYRTTAAWIAARTRVLRKLVRPETTSALTREGCEVSNPAPTEARQGTQSGNALVSVIIPTYNRAAFVGTAVESALAQTYRLLEVIVVDDGSSDDSQAALSRYGDEIVLLRHERNRGLSAARNTGIAASRGSHLAFLDSDDLWEPTKLARQMAELARQPEAGFCYCDYSLWESGEVRARAVVSRRAREAGPRIFEHLVGGNFVSACAIVIPRHRLEAVGLFDESLTACEDWDMALRLAACWPVAYVDEPLVRVCLHEDNMSADLPRMFRNGAVVLAKALRTLDRPSARQRRALMRTCARVLALYGRELFYQGHPDAHLHIRESLRLCWSDRALRYWLAGLLPAPLQRCLRRARQGPGERRQSRRHGSGQG